MRGKLLKSVLLAASLVGFATGANAAISVTVASGAGPFDFSVAPNGGEWDTGSIGAAAGTYTTDAGLETAAKNVNGTAIATALAADAADPIGTGGLARWMSTTLAIGIRPTGTDFTAIKASFVNAEPDVITSMRISYTLKTNTPAGSVINEHVYGQQVYFSFTGTPGSWTRIPQFNVGNFADPQNLTATLTLNWQPGSPMFLLWVDDNGPSSGTAPNLEGGYLLDDFVIADVVTQPVVPPVITLQPVGTTVDERGNLSLTVAANGALTYQWFRGPTALTDSATCADGLARSVAGATTANLTLTGVRPGDAGQYRCDVGNTAGTVPSANAAVAVTADTTPPKVLYATCGSNPNEFVVVFSEPLNDGDCVAIPGISVTDISNWQVKDVGGVGLGLGVINFTNQGSFAGVTVLGLITSDPHVSGLPVEISWSAPFSDTAAAQNAMDPGSILALCYTNQLLGLTAPWQYNDEDVDPGASWANVGFVDTAAPWETGTGPFDAKRDAGVLHANGLDDCRAMTLYGLGAVGTCLNLQSPVTMTNLITAYFRTHFSFTGTPASSVIVLEGKADDGAVIYLNGTEVGRVGLPATTTHTTFASRTVGDGDAQDVIILGGPASLVSGDNVLAVALHQVNLTSSDLTMGLKVSQLVSTPPTVLTITFDGIGNTATISWTGGGTLRSSTSVTAAKPWPAEAGAVSPHSFTPTGPQKFYYVEIP